MKVVVGERKDRTVVMSMMEAGWCFCANVTPTPNWPNAHWRASPPLRRSPSYAKKLPRLRRVQGQRSTLTNHHYLLLSSLSHITPTTHFIYHRQLNLTLTLHYITSSKCSPEDSLRACRLRPSSPPLRLPESSAPLSSHSNSLPPCRKDYQA